MRTARVGDGRDPLLAVGLEAEVGGIVDVHDQLVVLSPYERGDVEREAVVTVVLRDLFIDAI